LTPTTGFLKRRENRIESTEIKDGGGRGTKKKDQIEKQRAGKRKMKLQGARW